MLTRYTNTNHVVAIEMQTEVLAQTQADRLRRLNLPELDAVFRSGSRVVIEGLSKRRPYVAKRPFESKGELKLWVRELTGQVAADFN